MKKIKVPLANSDTLGMRIVYWKDVSKAMHAANPYVAHLIDEANPGKNYPMVLASYPYGVDIHKHGETYFPANNNYLATIENPIIDNEIRKLLHYSPCPLGLVIDKAVEIYVESDEGRSIPFKLFEAGAAFGVWEIMGGSKIQMRKPWSWNISSGARSTFLLPSINERNSFNKLQTTYDLTSQMPKTIFDHRKIFAEIAQHSNINWKTQILFFPKIWLNNASLPLAKLKQHWYMEAWRQAEHWTGRITLDYSWELFMHELDNMQIKAKPYILDTIKHLISIGCCTMPAFRPVSESSITLPVALIQEAYINEYQLKYYQPIIMQPSFLNLKNKRDFIYYSLQYPTLPEKPSQFTNFPSTLKMLCELKKTMDIFLDLAKKWSKISSSEAFDFLDHIHFEYFHTEKYNNTQIVTTDQLFIDDPLLKINNGPYSLRVLPDTAHFFRGCVRIGFTQKIKH